MVNLFEHISIESFTNFVNIFICFKKVFCVIFWPFSGGNGNFVLSTSFVGYTPVFGGVLPMCNNGYGCFYAIQDT